MNNPVRSFIAVELNTEFHKYLAQIQNDLKKLGLDAKWINPEIMHLTLKFLGNIPQNKMDSIIEIFENSFKEFEPFTVEPSQLGVFPRIESPQIIWLGLTGDIPLIQKMVKILEDNFGQIGIAKERRDFQTHITLGRLKSKKNVLALADFLKNSTLGQGMQQTIDHITLFKSTLTAQGPVYEAIAVVQLK